MFDKKNMFDTAMKPRQLTSTGKTLQEQLLQRGGDRSIQDEDDWKSLDLSKGSQAVFSVLPLSSLYQVQCLAKAAAQAHR